MKIAGFEWYPSPNFTKGQVKHLYLVVHGTGGNLTSALAWMCNRRSSVSAHFLIGKAGKAYQLVDTDNKAWHAGKNSRWGEVTGLNSYSIGVELENLDNATDPYTEAQYEKLAELHRLLWAAYPSMLQTVGHQDILSTKRDPGPMFDWDKFRAMCNPVATSGEEPSTWAESSWRRFTSLGIVDGSAPQGLVTREQVVVIVDRAIQKLTETGGE